MPGDEGMRGMKEELTDPSKEYRCVPFWSWNDKLDPDELRWQIREMKDKGIGGFFMHARGGLETPYMSRKWMDCVEVCVEEAGKYDMEAWLYDEEGWPSGFAGGEVTALGDSFHTRWLEASWIPLREAEDSESILGIYDEEFHFLGKEVGYIKERTEEFRCCIIRQESNPYYVDVLNPAVVRKFLEMTHERYTEVLGDRLGEIVPGFFTDEPQYAKMKIPYSYLLPEEFEKEHGYPLTVALPSLFFHTPGCREHRYDFWKTVSRMFTEGYMKTVCRWCSEHGCRLTGHLMREDSLLMQMQATAGVMPSYEYMDMPGIDWLRRRISSPLTPRQAGSVAAQLGKRFVISEMYAMTGWDCTPEELKWIAQWQYVNGVNRMCQHLEAYSIRGIRKRDFPPSLFYQQTWWEEYKSFNDYFARLGVLLTFGEPETEVLLIHPMRSAWMLYDGKEEGPVKEFGQKFEELSQALLDVHIDHHYGDEGLMEKYGEVRNGKLWVGKCGYRAVILPDMISIEASGLSLLLRFAAAGGQIFSMGEFPSIVPGQSPEGLLRLRECVSQVNTGQIKKLLDETAEFPVSLTENGREIKEVHYQMRREGQERVLYLVNLNREEGHKVLLKCRGYLSVTLYDPLNNQEAVCRTMAADGYTLLEFPLEAMDSKVFLIKQETLGTGYKGDIPVCEPAEQGETEWEPPVVVRKGGTFDVLDMDMNAYTLDYCWYRINDGEWHGKIHIIQLMDILLKEKKRLKISLRFQFCIEAEPQELGEIFLAAEVRGMLDARINGTAVRIRESGWWKDKGFRKYAVGDYLVRGNNEVILEIDFCQSRKVYDVLFGENVLETEKNKLTFQTEIENIYLIGNFGVYNRNGFLYSWRKELICDDDFFMAKLPEKIYGDELTSQGFCFFAGKIKIGQKLFIHGFDDSRGVKIVNTENARYLCRFGKPNAMFAKLYINGALVRKVLWQPYECEITDYIHPGENEIVWELYASNRNLLGPHHHMDGELYAVWPEDFTGTPSPFKADIRKVWSDQYHFVKFGL